MRIQVSGPPYVVTFPVTSSGPFHPGPPPKPALPRSSRTLVFRVRISPLLQLFLYGYCHPRRGVPRRSSAHQTRSCFHLGRILWLRPCRCNFLPPKTPVVPHRGRQLLSSQLDDRFKNAFPGRPPVELYPRAGSRSCLHPGSRSGTGPGTGHDRGSSVLELLQGSRSRRPDGSEHRLYRNLHNPRDTPAPAGAPGKENQPSS